MEAGGNGALTGWWLSPALPPRAGRQSRAVEATWSDLLSAHPRNLPTTPQPGPVCLMVECWTRCGCGCACIRKKELLQEMAAFKKWIEKNAGKEVKYYSGHLKEITRVVKTFNMPLLKLASVFMLHSCRALGCIHNKPLCLQCYSWLPPYNFHGKPNT